MGDFRVTIAVAVNNRAILEQNLLRSLELAGAHPHQILLREGYPSASIAHNSALDAAANDIVVFLHQDVYFPYLWFSNLAKSIRSLDERELRWGVLGCFGCRRSSQGGIGSVYTTGRGAHGNRIEQPELVDTLDEIVLVIRRSSGLRFDPSLPHFHLYGTDICLEAQSKGLNTYVVPGFCVHNTNQLLRLPPQFHDCYRYVKRKWASRLPISTSCLTISPFDTDLRMDQLREVWSRAIGRRRTALRRVADPRSLLPLIPPHSAAPDALCGWARAIDRPIGVPTGRKQ
jgi:hypothetical protein